MAAKNLGDLIVRVVGDNAQFDASIDKSESKLKSFSNTASQIGGNLTKFISLPLIGIGAAAIKSAGDMEQAQLSFETLLGSGEKAKVLLGQLKKFADVTPFRFQDIADGAKTLLAFGVDAEKVLPITKELGDVALGDSQRFNALALVFGQVQAQGKLMGQDLLQLVNAGFNPLQEISRTTGESLASLKDRMTNGGISALDVANAFKTATEEGGRFFNGTQKLGTSFNGLVSTLADNAATLGRSFAELFLPTLKDIVKTLGDGIQFFTGLDESTKRIIVSMGLAALAAGPVISAIGAIGKAFDFLRANPTVLLLSGLFSVVAAMASVKAEADRLEQIRLDNTFGNVAKSLNLSSKEAETFIAQAGKIESAIAQAQARAGGVDIERTLKFATDRLGLTRDEFFQIVDASDKIDSGIKKQIDSLKTVNEVEKERLRVQQQIIDGQSSKIPAAIQAQIDLENKLRAAKGEALNDTQKGVAFQNQLVDLGLKKEEDALAEKIKIRETEIKLIEESAKQSGTLSQAQVDRISQLNSLNKDNLDQIELLKAKDKERADLKVIADQQILDSENLLHENTIQNLDAQLAKIEEVSKQRQKDANDTADAIITVNSAIFKQLGQDLAAGEVSWKSLGTVAINAIGQVITAIGAQMAAMAGLELGKWIGSAFLDGPALAAAVKLGLESALAFTAGAFLSSVKLAQGGIAMPRSGGVNATIAEAGKPEAVIPLDKLNQFISANNFSSGSDSQPMQVIVELDSRPILDKIFDATLNRQVKISQGAVV